MSKLLFSFLLAICLINISVDKLNAQSLSGLDLKSVRVDDLTDEQIRGYIKQAEARGLTQEQLEAIARQRGVSETEISKLRRRVAKLRSGGLIKTDSLGLSNQMQRNAPMLSEEEAFGLLPGEDRPELTPQQKQIFGFDVFRRNSLTFAPNLNLPTPRDYVLGPGDEVLVDLWGATQQFLDFKVSPEGTIRPENLSPVYVNGLTIDQAQHRIIDRLSQIYSGLKGAGGKSPAIFHQVSLGNIKTINVEVVGDVAMPGMYALNSLSTVYTALHSAGGPAEEGSFRDIRLVRNNEIFKTIDIYSYLTEGIKSGDVRLKSGDVIIVKPLQHRVTLDGEVRRPGLFEMKEGENFEDLLKYAGGFKNSAFKSLVTVKRNGDKEKEFIDVTASEFATFHPKDGDLIEVSAILDRFSNRVIIDGAVFRGGEYQLTDGLTLKQLIEKADGLRGDAYLARATIYRANEDFSQSTIPFDLGALMSGTMEDIPLLREDVVNISSIYDLREEYMVQISGEVLEEGVWPFFKDMTVKDLILLAKGLKESASGALVEISRRNKDSNTNTIAEIIRLTIDERLSLDPEEAETILEPFDQVYIRKSPGYTVQQQVIVEGEVLAPGLYTISRKDEKISDILKRAAGLTPYAYPEGAILIRKTEFYNVKSNDDISEEYLQQLRQKILSDESELKNVSQERLIERLKRLNIINSNNNSNNNNNNTTNNSSNSNNKGSQVKKDLIEDLAERDSLFRKVEIAEEEPVAINLNKILQNPGSKYDLIVRPGDVISIPGKLETVRVAGEVTSPLNVRFDESYSFKDYIHQSGGFLHSAKKGRSYVQYPNGERKGVRRFLFFKFYPKVEPGSTLFVSKKPDRQRLSTQAWISIGTGLVTFGLVAIQAIRLVK